MQDFFVTLEPKSRADKDDIEDGWDYSFPEAHICNAGVLFPQLLN